MALSSSYYISDYPNIIAQDTHRWMRCVCFWQVVSLWSSSTSAIEIWIGTPGIINLLDENNHSASAFKTFASVYMKSFYTWHEMTENWSAFISRYDCYFSLVSLADELKPADGQHLLRRTRGNSQRSPTNKTNELQTLFI